VRGQVAGARVAGRDRSVLPSTAEEQAERQEDLDLLTSVSDNIMGRTICALGDAAAMPVKSFVKHFRSEFQHHIDHKQCLVPPYL